MTTSRMTSGDESKWCCQSNPDLSPSRRNDPNPRLALAHDLPPLSQRGGASFSVEVSADEVAFLVEVVVDRAVDGGEFLEGFHSPKPLHSALSSSEW
jgi:hypothetical protein